MCKLEDQTLVYWTVSRIWRKQQVGEGSLRCHDLGDLFTVGGMLVRVTNLAGWCNLHRHRLLEGSCARLYATIIDGKRVRLGDRNHKATVLQFKSYPQRAQQAAVQQVTTTDLGAQLQAQAQG